MNRTLPRALGAALLAVAAVASTASAHGGDRHKSSKDTTAKLEITAKGAVSASAADSITVAPGGAHAPVTCVAKAGRTLPVLPAGSLAKIECKLRDGRLVARKLRPKAAVSGTLVKAEIRGTVSALAADSITISTGANMPSVTCAIDPAAPATGIAVGAFVKAKCKTTGDKLVLRRIVQRMAPGTLPTPAPPGFSVKLKGAVTALTTTSISIGSGAVSVTCQIPAGTTVVVKVGDRVTAKCAEVNGALTLKKLSFAGGLYDKK